MKQIHVVERNLATFKHNIARICLVEFTFIEFQV